jgi:hypothetical protein
MRTLVPFLRSGLRVSRAGALTKLSGDALC